jgi:hypothetical protein
MSRAVVTRAVALGLVITFWVVAASVFPFAPARADGDAWNYLAAGERLNAGHPLYVLSPGDRPVALVPPYWTVPLLSPPPIAVAWRPLAFLGELAMTLWGVACLIATLSGVAVLLARGSPLVAAILTVLAAPIAIQGLSGNVNGLLFPAFMVLWFARSRPWVVGAIVAAAISIKLTPILLGVWILAHRRMALGTTAVCLAVIGAVSIVGASLQAHVDWVRSVPTSAPAPGSVATLTGLPPSAVVVAFGLLVAAAATRRDERLTFSAAVLATTFASPALYLGHVGLAAAALTPWLLDGPVASWRALRASAR